MTKRKQILKMSLFIICILFMGLIMAGCSVEDLGIDARGKSAYQIAVENGFVGTEQEWLASLKGESGEYAGKGLSAYEIAVKNGFVGTEQEWLASLNTSEDKFALNLNKCLSSVVSITAVHSGEQSQGSGVIISYNKTQGYAYVLTNFHVVCSEYKSGQLGTVSSKISTYLYGRKYSDFDLTSVYVGGCAEKDLAVLKVYIDADVAENTVITEAKIGNSSKLAVGSKVGAIGNAKGSGISLTAGVLNVESEYSSVVRNDTGETTVIRVMRSDAYIINGNSGGGLFNDDGELVGIVNAKSKTEEFYFAIPSNLAYSVYQNIIANCVGSSNKTAEKIAIGVGIAVYDSNLVEDSETGKLFIKETVKVKSLSSILARTHFSDGDEFVSMSINGGKEIEIRRSFDITDAMWAVKSGDILTFKVKRNSEIKTVQLTAKDAYVLSYDDRDMF